MAKGKLGTEVTGVVIAGGRSTRMGSHDKALIGRPMIGHVIDRTRPQVERLTINANGDPSRFARFELPVVPDTIEDWPGPLAGLLAALEWARRETPEARFVASVAADTPFLPTISSRGCWRRSKMSARRPPSPRRTARGLLLSGYGASHLPKRCTRACAPCTASPPRRTAPLSISRPFKSPARASIHSST
jgi:hypothetical protein